MLCLLPEPLQHYYVPTLGLKLKSKTEFNEIKQEHKVQKYKKTTHSVDSRSKQKKHNFHHYFQTLVTLNMGQGHRNRYEHVKLNRGYHHA